APFSAAPPGESPSCTSHTRPTRSTGPCSPGERPRSSPMPYRRSLRPPVVTVHEELAATAHGPVMCRRIEIWYAACCKAVSCTPTLRWTSARPVQGPLDAAARSTEVVYSCHAPFSCTAPRPQPACHRPKLQLPPTTTMASSSPPSRLTFPSTSSPHSQRPPAESPSMRKRQSVFSYALARQNAAEPSPAAVPLHSSRVSAVPRRTSILSLSLLSFRSTGRLNRRPVLSCSGAVAPGAGQLKERFSVTPSS